MSRPIPPPKIWPDAAEARATQRLWASLVLSPRIEIGEALLAGVPVPARRLDPAWRDELNLEGDVTLDEALVLRVNAHGPLTDEAPVRRGDACRPSRVLRLGDAGREKRQT